MDTNAALNVAASVESFDVCGRHVAGSIMCNLPRSHADECGVVYGTMRVVMLDGSLITWQGKVVHWQPPGANSQSYASESLKPDTKVGAYFADSSTLEVVVRDGNAFEIDAMKFAAFAREGFGEYDSGGHRVFNDADRQTRLVFRCVGIHASKMDDATFRSFLDLLMCSDPWPVKSAPVDFIDDGEPSPYWTGPGHEWPPREIADDSQRLLTTFADAESRARGYDGWIVAYHEFDKPIRENETRIVITGSGFTRQSVVKADGVLLRHAFVSSSEIWAYMPTGTTAASVNVVTVGGASHAFAVTP